jgi:hypothetical protein
VQPFRARHAIASEIDMRFIYLFYERCEVLQLWIEE